MQKEEIAVTDTIIIKIGLTIPASTALCPKIKAPTIPIVGPIGEGMRKPPSRISSKENSITSNSIIIGNGTPALEATIVKSNFVGINSWWKFVIARYNAGRKMVSKIATTRTSFNKFAN